ncbi:MAG: AMP-binding protein [Clostridia bacterium]|nr:AMP-binding protein [Clostridia bacterium]
MKKDVYNLSKPQESIWLTEQYFKDTNINRIITLADFSSKIDNIDFELLNAAINHTVRQNDNFQIRLFLENGNVKQYFEEFVPFKCEFNDISSLEEFIDEDAKRENVFNLLENPLYEFRLFRIKGTNTGGILANFHHIICDGFSTAICVRQIAEIYNAFVNNLDLPLIDTETFSYKNYLASEKNYIDSSKFEKDRDYWLTKYETVPELATIRGTKSSSNDLVCSAERSTFVLDKDLLNKISNFCVESRISIYNFFMAVFGIYIGRVNNLNDFVIGTPVLNRANFKEKNTMGMFVSTIPFRMVIDDSIGFVSFVSNLAKDTMSHFRHQKYSYQYVLEELRKRDNSLPNLYNIMLSYQITRASDASCEYSTEWLFNHCSNNDLDIHIYDINGENSVSISYDYNLNKLDKNDIDLIHPRILYIINQVLNDNNILLKDIEIATPLERSVILNEFNDTDVNYPKNNSVIELFEEQVNLVPNTPAVNFENTSLTYSELNTKANSLAFYLQCKGVKSNDTVALYLDKSLESIIAIIATLKLGATYLPIDISYPNDRISYMIKDSNAKVLLTSSNLEVDLKVNIPKIVIDLNSDLYDSNTDFKSFYPTPSTPAYIMYTSGSTGTPKGVIVPNVSIVRLVKNTNFITFSKGDRILQTGSIAFDASTFEIWGALLNGLELFILKKTDLLTPQLFSNYIKENKISSLFLTTSLFNKFCEYDPKMFNTLKYLLIGGEALSFKHIKIVREANPLLNIVNGYGPTENTTFSTYYSIKDLSLGFIPIGFPLANSKCYVVSKSGTLQPVGVPGELWVAGDRFIPWIFK